MDLWEKNFHVMKGCASKILPYLRLMLTILKNCITDSFKWYQSIFLFFTHAKIDDNCKCCDYGYFWLQLF